ncbi:MAG: 3-hydroxyacyl-ACP dehydratase FabZ [Candidatus Omnitrophota bacterium]
MKSGKEYTFKEIKALIPYDYPFLFIDRIVWVEAGKKIICQKNVSGNEHYFAGHFKDDPVMPGVILIEAMAQATYLLNRLSPALMKPADGIAPLRSYFAGIKNLKFLKPVYPGDQLSIEITMMTRFKTSQLVVAKAFVRQALVCQGELMFVKGA